MHLIKIGNNYINLHEITKVRHDGPHNGYPKYESVMIEFTNGYSLQLEGDRAREVLKELDGLVRGKTRRNIPSPMKSEVSLLSDSGLRIAPKQSC